MTPPAPPALREWEITEWTERAAPYWRWRLCADGLVARSDGGGCASQMLMADRVADGTVYVSGVSSIAALVREVLALRATAEYWTGHPECFDGECDAPRDELDTFRQGSTCEHMQRRWATALDARRLAQIRYALRALASPAGDDNRVEKLVELVAELDRLANGNIDDPDHQ